MRGWVEGSRGEGCSGRGGARKGRVAGGGGGTRQELVMTVLLV